ncbi:methylmalonyl Co-A mutase-associated GTPase MeaB [Tepidiforma sp.]|uniref:methylmalonyl Co-A mutase-associated GTPase MeaB n=1 Tax=Tepidiforma sp. TaxID=2682230 RepID=UPI002ADE1686|nr:methylmalonyl Co-A mutase-associated GTPase MeaB [Tepidiforma sp.]
MDELVQRFLAGDRRALARIITRVENGTLEGRDYVRALYPHSGRAHIVGITGGAGSGKSTLTGALATELRRREKTVAIIAVDPSSPFTHGALLGDRIRMQDVTMDPGVYMRSMAGRGALGGLAPAIADVVAVVDAFGFDYVIIETIGAGQDEVEIAGTAMTTVLVNNPGTGDDIQALKAGIIEIADILVVNKADHPGADILVSQLQALLALSPADQRRPPILKTTATRNEGLAALADAIDEHRAYLESSGLLASHRSEDARHQLLAITQQLLLEEIRKAAPEAVIETLTSRIASRQLDPHTAAEELAALVLPRS